MNFCGFNKVFSFLLRHNLHQYTNLWNCINSLHSVLQSTFKGAKSWVKELRDERPSIIIALAGNKADLDSERKVTFEVSSGYNFFTLSFCLPNLVLLFFQGTTSRQMCHVCLKMASLRTVCLNCCLCCQWDNNWDKHAKMQRHFSRDSWSWSMFFRWSHAMKAIRVCRDTTVKLPCHLPKNSLIPGPIWNRPIHTCQVWYL